MSSEVWNDPKPRTTRIQSLPTISSIQLTHLYGKGKVQMEYKNTKRTSSMASSYLYRQFELFSKFGGLGSHGSQITLSQSAQAGQDDRQLECDNHGHCYCFQEDIMRLYLDGSFSLERVP